MRNFEEWLGRWYEAVPPVTFPGVYCYLILSPVDFTGEKLKAHKFVISGCVKSLQVLKRNSAYRSSDVFTVIRAEVRPSQRVNKKPHKVWVAVQTDGTILLIVRWYDSALWHNFSLRVWLPKIYEIYEHCCVFGAFLT